MNKQDILSRFPQIEGYSSGGGFIHWAIFEGETEWLINPWEDSDEEFINEMPSGDPEQVCLFGRYNPITGDSLVMTLPLLEGLELICNGGEI